MPRVKQDTFLKTMNFINDQMKETVDEIKTDYNTGRHDDDDLVDCINGLETFQCIFESMIHTFKNEKNKQKKKKYIEGLNDTVGKFMKHEKLIKLLLPLTDTLDSL